MNDSAIKHGELQLGIIAVIYREFFFTIIKSLWTCICLGKTYIYSLAPVEEAFGLL